jgi:hypothetical protein
MKMFTKRWPPPRSLTTILLICAVLAGVFPPSRSHAAASSPQVRIQLRTFTATIYYGPDKGFSLHGALSLRVIHDGQFSGSFVRRHAAAVPVSGQQGGFAIALAFDLGGGRYLFGSGTLMRDRSGKMIVGGTFTGPASADFGSWDSSYCISAGVHADSDPNGARNIINAFGYEFPGNVTPPHAANVAPLLCTPA